MNTSNIGLQQHPLLRLADVSWAVHASANKGLDGSLCGGRPDLRGRSRDRRSRRGADAGRDAETARKLCVPRVVMERFHAFMSSAAHKSTSCTCKRRAQVSRIQNHSSDLALFSVPTCFEPNVGPVGIAVTSLLLSSTGRRILSDKSAPRTNPSKRAMSRGWR